MKVSESLKIANVVVLPTNILDIATRTHNEYTKAVSAHKGFTIILRCSSGVNYEFRNEEFDTNEIGKKLQDRKVNKIEINFND